MPESDVLKHLLGYGRFSEAYHVTTFECYRETKDGRNQRVEVRVLDAGPEAAKLRYSVYATSEDGKAATGNSAETVELAMALVHWGNLDW
jgi:hypothetical protein